MAEDDRNMPTQDDKPPATVPEKVYIKDASFETPHSPLMFRKKWDPEIKVEFQNAINEIRENLYEVVLGITVTTSLEGEIAYLAEVQQAGLFTMKGFKAQQLHMKQNVFCLRYLFPYASAAISDLVARGGFPQLLLRPLNFRKLYDERMKQLKEATETA